MDMYKNKGGCMNESIDTHDKEKKNSSNCCVDPVRVEQVKNSMVADEVLYDTADFFKIFGDSTRLKILFVLKKAELCVGDLSEVLGMNQSAVSHQLRLLRQNNVVKFRKKGKIVFYSLDDAHVETLLVQGIEHVSHKL